MRQNDGAGGEASEAVEEDTAPTAIYIYIYICIYIYIYTYITYIYVYMYISTGYGEPTCPGIWAGTRRIADFERVAKETIQ